MWSAEKLILRLNFYGAFLYTLSNSVFELSFLYWNALQSFRCINDFVKSQG